MSRNIFPDEGNRLVYTVLADGNYVLAQPGVTCTITTDAAGLVPADIQSYPAQGSIPSSMLTVAAGGLLPDFYGPNDDSTILYVLIAGSTSQIFARAEERLDSIEGQLALLTNVIDGGDASGAGSQLIDGGSA